MINIDISYTIGKQINCTLWKSMFHESHWVCWDENQLKFKKVIFQKSYLEIAKHLFVDVIIIWNQHALSGIWFLCSLTYVPLITWIKFGQTNSSFPSIFNLQFAMIFPRHLILLLRSIEQHVRGITNENIKH